MSPSDAPSAHPSSSLPTKSPSAAPNTSLFSFVYSVYYSDMKCQNFSEIVVQHASCHSSSSSGYNYSWQMVCGSDGDAYYQFYTGLNCVLGSESSYFINTTTTGQCLKSSSGSYKSNMCNTSLTMLNYEEALISNNAIAVFE